VQRSVDKELLKWKNDPERKSLLLRGARQVGKTYALRKLGETFKYFFEINFEELPEAKVFFDRTRNPQELCEKLSIYFDIPIVPGETLLFFDEIQACPNALKSLRFFYEKMPQLHVAAAGSLLEFALEEIPSHGVGRITSIFMYPMTFSEYLIASGSENLEKLIRQSSPLNPPDSVFHEKILDKLKIFQVIGGMPETVATYLKHRDFSRCQKVLNDLITTIIDDFAKYKERVPVINWHREAKSSNAEIDYVISSREHIIPIEVKAGTKGQMQSLHIFLSERDLPWGIRISGENFATYANIKTIPLYAISQVFA
jgi:predicted AAA+ superfamily ATPase